MLSNKLTFSLASLVVLFALVFATTSVMAAPGGPTVTITEYSGKTDPNDATSATYVPTRADFRVKIEFSEAVTEFGGTEDTDVEVKAAISPSPLYTTDVTVDLDGTGVLTSVTASNGKVFVLMINIGDTVDASFTYSSLRVRVPADAAEANDDATGNQQGTATFSNLPGGTGYTITPSLHTDYTAADVDAGKLKAAAVFTVNFTASGSTGAVTVPVDQIQIQDTKGMDIPTADYTLDPASGSNLAFTNSVAPLQFTVASATAIGPIVIGVNPNYAAGGTIQVPPAATPAVKPTVDISLVAGSLDETAMTFKVRFTFSAATALTPADITVEKADPMDAMKMVAASVFIDDQAPAFRGTADQMIYVATIDYGFGSESLPLYVSTSIATASMTVNGAASTMPLKVGESSEPSMLPQPTNVMVTRNAAQTGYTVSWTPPTVTTGIGGYYVMYNPTMYVSGAATRMATISTKPTSVSVWSTADTTDQSSTATAPSNAAAPTQDLSALLPLTGTGTGPGTGTDTPMGGTTNAAATGTRGAISFMLDAAALEAGDYIILHPATAMNGIDLATASNVSTTVVPDAAWTDLEEFFRFGGGSIDLIGPAGSLDKDVVISEIMWAADATPLANIAPTRSQWIELYVTAGETSAKDVTTATLAKAGTWMLKIASGNPGAIAANTTDRMSNWGLGQWNVTSGSYGQNGSLGNLAGNGIPASSPVAFVSMYRNINHKDLVKTDKNRADQLNAIPDGTRSGSWKEDESNRGSYQTGNRFATPGQAQIIGIVSADDDQQTLARDSVVFNEIANRSKKEHEWIELHNEKTASVNIKNWTISIVTSAPLATDTADQLKAKDKTLVKFESDDDITIPGGGYLIVVNTDPAATSLAVGENAVDSNTAKQGVDTLYYVDADLDIPAKFTLILRTEEKASSHEKIADIAVGGGGYFGLVDDDPLYNTDVWPLKSVGAGAKDDLGENDAKTWVRDQGKDLFHGDAWKPDGGVTGVGIDRNATEFNSGTPGYANDAVQGEFFDADAKAKYTGMISISEVMVDQTRRNLPQWIEIYNNSRTQAVNIKGWELKIMNVNSADLDARVNSSIKIDGDLIIAPSQTALIVSSTGRYSRDNIPSSSIYNLYAKHRKDLEMNSQRDSILSLEGFYISLSDARDVVADSVGNIDGNTKTDDAPTWALPMSEDMRSSIIRVHTGGTADDGTTAAGWTLASMTNLVPQTYYGDPDDMSSPGNRQGSPLPVSLSSFRPLRDKATGAVVIRWITESEINNAGFNILRSETKKGEFKVVNLKGIIPGHGTTSEKHTYEWTDTTAKPNVVYYYQIEDVSLDGKRTRLAQTHLRGNVNAAGKAATTWGELKSQR